jgi:hypothetical protein
MTDLLYVKPERILLANHSQLNERWVQEHIAEDPSLLGLGDLELRGKERIQPHAGRLDLLFQDAETYKRYEVEVQLGKTDQSHIIRTIEYWDIERKRYPQYDHTAVIVAEDITSRFLNVISLFNGSIPLVAIKMQAFALGGQVSLVFTTVLDEMSRGLVDDDGDTQGIPTDRAYWEQRASRNSLEMTDSVLSLVRQLSPDFSLSYNKHYIGLRKNGQPNNFVVFIPKRDWLRFEPRIERSDAIQTKLEEAREAGVDVIPYDIRGGRYRIRLFKDDIQKHEDLIRHLIRKAYEDTGLSL